jgi:tetratricopeptide (TPR) repeat protein
MFEAHTLLTIGMLLAQQNRFDEGSDHLERVVRLAHTGGHTQIEAAAHAGLCLTHRAQGNLASAFEHGRAALGLARDHRLLIVECEALNALGEAHLAACDLPSAEVTFRHAAGLAGEQHLRSYEARAHEGFAHIALYRGDITVAQRGLRRALSIYPPDVAEAANARSHLAEHATPETRCLRCWTGPAAAHGTAAVEIGHTARSD